MKDKFYLIIGIWEIRWKKQIEEIKKEKDDRLYNFHN